MSAHVNIDIVYEDDQMMLVNKPIGVVVHEGVGTQGDTVVDWVQLKGCLLGEKERWGVVHRLDKNTEGLMVIAKTDVAYRSLSQQFHDRRVEKRYYAMVRGDVVADSMVIDKPIGRDRSNRLKRSCHHPITGTEREARTHYRVMKRYNTKTLLDVRIETGRTHQIRVHLASINHPVMGDPLYGRGRQGKKMTDSAQLLQAYYLEVSHPTNAQKVHYELPISSRF